MQHGGDGQILSKKVKTCLNPNNRSKVDVDYIPELGNHLLVL